MLMMMAQMNNQGATNAPKDPPKVISNNLEATQGMNSFDTPAEPPGGLPSIGNLGPK